VASGDGREVRFDPVDGPPMRLVASVPLRAEGGDAVASFRLRQGESATCALAADRAEDGGDDPLSRDVAAHCNRAFEGTVAFWRRWIGGSTYRGRARAMVNRSALVLKLMTAEEFGSIVAAPTFGLPEALGGVRNWDYRYTWVRDAAFTLYAFIRLGFTDEATGFMGWIYGRVEDRRRAGREDGTLQIMYGLDGRADLPEATLDHLAGYAGSRPVRVGNAAFGQLQLDSYGALMDAVYLAKKYGTPISYDGWQAVTRTVDWVCANWRQPDQGIWEFRGGRQEFLSSRLMCWVAVDRAQRMVGKFSLPALFARWQEARNDIHSSVYEDFWDDGLRAFVQAKDRRALDASCLLMPLVRFVSLTDPRWPSTLDAVGARLATDALVRRYDVRDSGDAEGSFTVCSFWYVECLARAGRVDEARLMFDKLLSYANHLGLNSEELGPAGDHLGDFPQALTHLALISAAVALDRALDGPRVA
jgi:GH15 family glucan-1,4-alpha-glucosidase